MSRHKKVRNLDYEEEYDDYYGEFDDDDDDFDGEAFETKYLSTGIDLSGKSEINDATIAVNKQRQLIIDEVKSKFEATSQIGDETTTTPKSTPAIISDIKSSYSTQTPLFTPNTSRISSTNQTPASVDSVTSDLTRIAIQHLDKHQWRLPLMEMDKKFRDKTYYKHYTDAYISSLQSKLGHFLTDTRLISNPMRYHMQQEQDNYSKYSRMFESLTEYYQSLGGCFFSFATPSPDEEIAIGCRLGTKVKKQTPKQNAPAPSDEPKAARFEYQGKPAKKQQQPSNSKNETQASKSATPNAGKNAAHSTKKLPNELTIREDHTVEQLDTLTKKYKESLKVRESTPTTTTIATSKTSTAKTSAMSTGSAKSKLPAGGGSSTQGVKSQQQLAKTNRTQPKQLATLTEKRQNLKQQLKRRLEPSAQDIETFKRQSQKTRQEYNEIMKTSRPRINLVVVGHVDAGKSTLVGHLLFKLNEVSSQQMHKNQRDSKNSGKASFKFAWALDETKEERDRGVTIDIALTKFSTNHKDVVLLDAPGHVDFIPAVISGAAQADAALLVVDATKGEFETGFSSGGQTREHTFLVRSLGVKSLVVVVNKMDNVNWNAHRFTDIVEQLKPFLKQVGFNLEQDVQFVVCSGLTGENLTERRMDKIKRESSHPQLEGDDSQINWNTMPSLLEAIDQMKEPERLVDKPTRVCVTDVFKGMSSGVFLGGKVAAGKLEVKQKLLLLPPNEGCEVKQVEVRETSSQRAFAGDIITTTITGVDMNKFYRGCILCDPLIPCLVSNRFHARVIMLDSANAILIKGTPIEVHINGSYESGEVKRLLSLLNKNTGELIQKKPRCLAKNASAIISIRLARSVCCELYEDNKILGRFMIRCLGKTIAAGLITKVKPAKLSKNRIKFKSK